MSLSQILGTALTGLTTNQTALRVTASNIANVNTENYSRQVVNREAFVIEGTSIGVKISGIERIVDRFLQAAGFDANSRSFESDIQRQFLERFQGILGSPDSESNLSARVSQLFGRLADLALNPAEQILRQSVISSVQDLVDEVSRLSLEIQELRTDANRRVEEDVSAINEALRRIHELNPLIVRQRAVGGETGSLENQRDKALLDLAEIIDIRVSHATGGAVHISTGSGTVLLDSSLRELDYRASGVVTSETIFSPIQIFRLDPVTDERIGTGRDFDADVGAGSLRGVLDLRDRDLRNLSLTLGEFAGNFIEEVNQVHNAFTAVPPPNQLVGKQTAIPSAQSDVFAGETDFAVVDENGAVVQKVTLDFTTVASFTGVINTVNVGLAGAGTLSLVNGVMSFTATNPNHGVVIADNPANPSSRGGQSFSRFFGLNDLLEAAVDTNYNTGVSSGAVHGLGAGEQITFRVTDNKGVNVKEYTYTAGGVSVADILADFNDPAALGNFFNFSVNALGGLDIDEQPGFEGSRLSVLTDTTSVFGTNVTFTRQFGIGDRYRVDRARDIRVLEAIREQPQNLALAYFDRTALVGEVALDRGDQSGALAFQELETKVTDFRKAGELGNVTMSLDQYAAAFLSNAGLIAGRAAQRAEDSQALLNEIDVRIGEVSGVNLDEELANMVVLQTAYNASARIVTTSREMFNEILSLVR